MKNIIKWLREIEHLAGEMYLQAASIYKTDANLKRFLERTAEDEAWHYHVMGSAAALLASEPNSIPAISVDKETGDKIVKLISDIRIGLEQKTLQRDELIEKIVAL